MSRKLLCVSMMIFILLASEVPLAFGKEAELPKMGVKSLLNNIGRKLLEISLVWEAGASISEEKIAALLVIQNNIVADQLSYWFIDYLPKEFLMVILRAVSYGISSSEIKAINRSIELAEDLNTARNILKNWLIKNQIKISVGYLNKKLGILYIISYRPSNKESGEVEAIFYSTKTLKLPHEERGSIGGVVRSPGIKSGKLKPFKLTIRGQVKENFWGYSYTWKKTIEGPKIEFSKDVSKLLEKKRLSQKDITQPQSAKVSQRTQAASLKLKSSWSTNIAKEMVIGLKATNVEQKGDKIKADIVLWNSTLTWVYVEQDFTKKKVGQFPVETEGVYLLGPLYTKNLGTKEFSKGSFLQFNAKTATGVGHLLGRPESNMLLGALAIDLAMRGFFSKELPPNAFDHPLVLPIEIGMTSIDPLFSTITSHCSGPLGAFSRAVTMKDTDNALNALGEFLLCTTDAPIREKVQDWLTKLFSKEVAKKWTKKFVGSIGDFLNLPMRFTLMKILTESTLTAPPESWVRIEAVEAEKSAQLQIVSDLRIFESPPYKVGQTITAEFSIKNIGTSSIIFDILTVGGRVNGICPKDICPDFEWKENIKIKPNKIYLYKGKLKLEAPGNYHFFTAYRTKDGWTTAIPTAAGVTNTVDIVVHPLKKQPIFSQTHQSTATALVIDHSGSMGRERKLELAREAARTYIDSVPVEDWVSVAGFSSYATSIVDMCLVKTCKEKLKKSILSLHSTSSTNIGAGLKVGLEQLFAKGQIYQNPIILLLSDGRHNTGKLWPWVEECKKKKVKVYTVAFGSNADQTTLCKIAHQTGGRCSPAGLRNLSHVYHKINIYVHNKTTLFASNDWLKPLQELIYKVEVPSDFRDLTFFTNWQGSDVQTILVKPDGSLLYPSSQNGDYRKGTTYSIFRVQAEPGLWKMKLRGYDIPQEGEQINVSISGSSDIYSNFLTFQPEYKRGQKVLIRVEVARIVDNQKIPLEGVKVKAKIEGPAPQLLKKVGERRLEINLFKFLEGLIFKKQEIDLYDDGMHDDYGSKDGIFAGTFWGGDVEGPYLVTVNINGQFEGKIISRQIQESFQVGPIQNNQITISDFIQIRSYKK